jgi:hypothetical protein
VGITIKATSPNLLMGLIVSVTNCRSTRNTMIGDWHELWAEGVILPGHVSSFFLCSALSPTTFNPVANFVSTVNLICDCPRSLLTALTDSHSDREVWLQRYFEEKWVIESLGMLNSDKLKVVV